jgi:uncharacterized protein
MYTHSRPIELESKAITESADGDAWIFSAYASIFGSKDLGGDVVMPGAFAKSLKENGLPALLWQHKVDEPIGVITEAREERRGLFVRGELPKSDQLVSGRA